MLIRTTKAKDERGATAILTAVLALALFGTAALAVDLGHAFARKGDTQVQADFAALAGASKLPDQTAAVEAVAQYLVDNAARDDSGSAPATQAAMETALTNADPTDGHIEFLDDSRMRVVSPIARVDFAFGGVFASDGGGGASGVDVVSDATVLIGSPKGNGVLPMYVASPTPGNPACDYGLQTLTDPPDGQVVPPSVPTLYADSDTNGSKLEGIATFESGAVPVTSLAKDTTTGSIRLDGDYNDATAVGFFRSDSATTAPVMIEPRIVTLALRKIILTASKSQMMQTTTAMIKATHSLYPLPLSRLNQNLLSKRMDKARSMRTDSTTIAANTSSTLSQSK